MTGSFLPDGVFRSEICFGDSDTDCFGRVENSALLWQLQEIAGAHYDTLGWGYERIRSHGCFWAVIRNELVITTPPRPGETLWLDTWNGRSAHGLYRRHYRLQRPDGTVLVRGVSVWVLMDAAERALVADRSWLPEPAVLTQPGELSPARKVPFPELTEREDREVLSAEIDRNGHLNNTVYLRWAADILPEEFAAAHTLGTLWVEYKKELLPGETAELAYSLAGQTLFLRGAAEGRESFQMRCTYDPI